MLSEKILLFYAHLIFISRSVIVSQLEWTLSEIIMVGLTYYEIRLKSIQFGVLFFLLMICV